MFYVQTVQCTRCCCIAGMVPLGISFLKTSWLASIVGIRFSNSDYTPPAGKLHGRAVGGGRGRIGLYNEGITGDMNHAKAFTTGLQISVCCILAGCVRDSCPYRGIIVLAQVIQRDVGTTSVLFTNRKNWLQTQCIMLLLCQHFNFRRIVFNPAVSPRTTERI